MMQPRKKLARMFSKNICPSLVMMTAVFIFILIAAVVGFLVPKISGFRDLMFSSYRLWRTSSVDLVLPLNPTKSHVFDIS